MIHHFFESDLGGVLNYIIAAVKTEKAPDKASEAQFGYSTQRRITPYGVFRACPRIENLLQYKQPVQKPFNQNPYIGI